MRHSRDILNNVYCEKPTGPVGHPTLALAARHFCFDVAIARILERTLPHGN